MIHILNVTYEFQFHNGTIKTIAGVSPKVHFNYFNSIMVRLRLPYLQRGDAIMLKFQFHNGTIKTHHIWEVIRYYALL